MSLNYFPELEAQFDELKSLNEKINVSIEEIARKQFLLFITIDPKLINKDDKIKFLDDIRFILLLKANYPKNQPLLYCVSKFIHPGICDCRDLLEDTIQTKWKKKYTLKMIINKIPSFIINYISKAKQNLMIGKYYLDSIYEISIIQYTPFLYYDSISEILLTNNKNNYSLEDRKILLTESFLLLFNNKSLFELDQLKLIFVGPIKSLSFIKQIYKEKIIELKWCIKNKKKYSVMRLKSKNSNLLVNTLIQNLTNKKIGFTISDKKFTGKKQGAIPQIEIKLVENGIKEAENIIINKKEVTKENITNLINLYEKAIQYYSALNDDKFKILLKKIQDIYSNEEYTMVLNKTDLMNQKYNNLINNNNEKGVFSISINDESSKEEENNEKKDENVGQKKGQEYNLDSDDDEDDDEEEKSKNKKNENNTHDKKNEEKEKEKDVKNDENKDGNANNNE